MVELARLLPDSDARLFGKLEAFNPGGSVKDRIGVAMIEAAEAEGRIEPGKTTIVEATSGNTGIALAFVCAAKGYDLDPHAAAGHEPRARGAAAALRRAGRGHRVDGRHERGGRRGRASWRERDDVFLPDQFSNPANPEAHRRTTGPEIFEATRTARSTCFVAGVGTGGTITGVGEVLKERNPDLQVSRSSPPSSAVLSGGAAGPAQDPGHRRRLRPAGAQPRACSTR